MVKTFDNVAEDVLEGEDVGKREVSKFGQDDETKLRS